MTHERLLSLAREARRRAYAPYSGFFVGAAVLCADGSVYTGCNIENASFSPTCCAERVAIFSAVKDGKRDIRAIAVVGGKNDAEAERPCYPCGVCRQVMREFGGSETKIIFADNSEMMLGELLPCGFDGMGK